MNTQDIATIAGLSAGVAVTVIFLAIIIYQFVRFRKQQKKKAEEEALQKDRRSWQTRSREVPYKLGEDVFPSTYPDYPEYPDYPVDYPAEYPVDYPDFPVAGYPEPPRARFFPVEEAPYPTRPSIQQQVIFECEPEPQPEPRIIYQPAAPPPEPQPIVVYQPLPKEPAPPPQREIIREIYFPSQPQPLPPPPPRERRGSWCGPSNDDWVLVKKEVKKRKPKKRAKRVEDSDDDDDDDESVSSSSSEEEDVSPYHRRLMPYDLAMPRIQLPQMPAPPIYFIPQQPAPVPAPVPAPAPAPAPIPVPLQRNAFFAANVRRFDDRQYEEQEQRANVVTENYDWNECNF